MSRSRNRKPVQEAENPTVKVCLYAICKNEEKNVDEWMAYADEADFIYVLDTGSEDGTLTKLSYFAQEDPKVRFSAIDFSETERGFRFDDARNKSIELAEEAFPEADVFLTTDLDERLDPGWAGLIREGWSKSGHMQRIGYSWAMEGAKVLSTRNWGHARGWRWKYPCHEVMIRGYDGDIWYKPDERLDLCDKLVVWHHKDFAKPRDFYLDLLRKRADEYRDVPSYAYLVREYSYRQDWEAILDWEHDIEQAIAGKEGNEAMTCCVYIAMAHSFLKHADGEAEKWYKLALEKDDKFRFAWFEYAMHMDRMGDREGAYRLLKEGYEKSVRIVHVIFVDQEDMWTWRYLDWCGVEAYWLDELDEAAVWFGKALEKAPEGHPKDHVWFNLRECTEKHYHSR